MAGAALAQISAARLAVELGRDRLEDGLGVLPFLLGAADHDRGAVAGALFATGDTDAEEADALGLQIFIATLAVGIERIAAFEDGVAGLEHGQQVLDHFVDGLAGLDHDDDRARALHGLDEGGDVGFGDDLAVEALRLGRHHEVVDLGRRPVVDRDGVALLGDIEREVGAHHRETDQADIGSRRH